MSCDTADFTTKELECTPCRYTSSFFSTTAKPSGQTDTPDNQLFDKSIIYENPMNLKRGNV